jgi:ATP-dependent RNA helicase RhlE
MSKSFQELGVSASVATVLQKQGITHPFAIQNLVLPDALAGLDILAESPTGSGKTLAFGLPLVERTAGSNARPGALVLVPTRELALQVAADLQPLAAAKGLKVVTVYGGAPIGAQISKARGAHILVATPGRLFDLIERRAVKLNDVRVLVLDEADRMLDMGFKPQVDRILRGVPDNRQTMLFSATFDGAVAELARAYTVNASHVRGALPAEAERGEIDHAFVAVTSEDKLERLVEQLRAERGLVLVFVRTKHGADKLARKLERQHRIPTVAMHGNLSQNQRERALKQFESGRVSTLVATDVAARGLDVDDITHVINFDPPHGDDDYVHRIGRTGRAGRSGNGVTLVLPEQRNDVGRLATRLGHGDQFAASGMTVSTRPARSSGSRPAQRPAQRRRRR